MTHSAREARSDNRSISASTDARTWGTFGLVGAGLLLLAVSFVAPLVDDGRAAWTPEKAEQLAAASRQLHQLSATPPTPYEGDRYERVSTNYQQLQAELKAAQARPAQTAWFLRAVAAALIVGGTLFARSR